jgi:hypothetical protein
MPEPPMYFMAVSDVARHRETGREPVTAWMPRFDPVNRLSPVHARISSA